MNILVAPNTFKNSLDARRAALAIEKGLKQSGLDCTITRFPVGDGGDGTGDLLIEHFKAERIFVEVTGPLGKPVTASYGFNGRVAIIELADASGLRLLDPGELNPLKATTYGTGELIKDAIKRDAAVIILGIGGSATVDGGTGILRALGYRFFDEAGNELRDPASMTSLHHYEPPEVAILRDVLINLFCDVRNPLLGPNGAAAVFGPQKGATESTVPVLEAGLQRLRDVVFSTRGIEIGDIEHGGASGGVAAGLYGIADAHLLDGALFFLSITNFSEKVELADLIITGEGSLDSQTMEGKAPKGVASMAKMLGKKVVGMAGVISSRDLLIGSFDKLIEINGGEKDLTIAMRNTATNLEIAARALGEELANKGLDF